MGPALKWRAGESWRVHGYDDVLRLENRGHKRCTADFGWAHQYIKQVRAGRRQITKHTFVDAQIRLITEPRLPLDGKNINLLKAATIQEPVITYAQEAKK